MITLPAGVDCDAVHLRTFLARAAWSGRPQRRTASHKSRRWTISRCLRGKSFMIQFLNIAGGPIFGAIMGAKVRFGILSVDSVR